VSNDPVSRAGRRPGSIPRIPTAVLLSLIAVSCDRQPTAPTREEPAASQAHEPPRQPTEPATATNEPGTPPPVLFAAPRFSLLDPEGVRVDSQQLSGRVWVAGFLAAGDGEAGSRQAEQFLALQRRSRKWPDRERLKLVTFGLRHDAPGSEADRGQWMLLAGERAGLADVVNRGFRIPPAVPSDDASAPITRSARVALVDGAGRVRNYYDANSDEDFDRLVADVRTVLSESVPGSNETVHVGNPPEVFDPPWLERRRADQLATRGEIGVFTGFGFEDRVGSSGITFVNRAVPDAARDFKSNHYDHANGMAAADVDGDGLLDLYFTSQVGGNQLWRNVGGGRFEDVTADAGVALVGRVSVSASFADSDNDGDPDLFVTTTRHGNAFFENRGGGRFRDATADAGLGYVGHSSGGDFFDYDGDGFLDLLLTNVGIFTTDEIGFGDAEGRAPYYIGQADAFGGHLYRKRSERCVLYRNEGGNRFRDVTEEAGLVGTGWAGDATPIDANADGRPDLYVLDMQGNDDLFLNRDGRRFERVDRGVFPKAVWGGMGVKSFDYDNDGLADLFVTNMHADMWQLKRNIEGPEEKRKPPADVMPESYLQSREPGNNVLGNSFYRNSGGGKFEEISDEIGAETYWPWGLSVGDLNADGYQDAFICSCMNYPFRYHPNTVLLNDRGTAFREAEFILGVEPRRGDRTAAPWYELDCSGADSTHKLCEGRTGRVAVWGAVGSRSSVIFDLEQDGDLDVVTNDFNTGPMVLVSDLAERKPDLRYLAVRLKGTASNRDGLGAIVRVTAGGRTLTQFHDGQSGYLSQSSLPLYFGLGDAESVDEISVEWPRGDRQVLRGPLDPNRTVSITEGQEEAETSASRIDAPAPPT